MHWRVNKKCENSITAVLQQLIHTTAAGFSRDYQRKETSLFAYQSMGHSINGFVHIRCLCLGMNRSTNQVCSDLHSMSILHLILFLADNKRDVRFAFLNFLLPLPGVLPSQKQDTKLYQSSSTVFTHWYLTLGFLLTDRWTSHSRMAPLLESLLRLPPILLLTYCTKASVRSMLVPETTKGTWSASSAAVDDKDTNDGLEMPIEGVVKPEATDASPRKLRRRRRIDRDCWWDDLSC